MPSSITEPIYNGKNVSFEEFMWRCARLLMVFIHMRDDPTDAKLRLRSDSLGGKYHKDKIKEAKDSLKHFEEMTAAEWKAANDAAHVTATKEWHEGFEKERTLIKRYNSMLDRVKAWTPPTPDHEGLKQTAIQQLEQALQFDTGTYTKYTPEPPVKPDWKTYRDQRIARAQQDIDYHTRQLSEESERAKGMDKWIKDLDAALPAPDHMRGEGF